MRPKKYPYLGRRKRQDTSSLMFSSWPILNEVPITEEVKVELGVEAKVGHSHPEMLIHLDVSGYIDFLVSSLLLVNQFN